MSYVNIWIHAVWGTKNRYPFLTKELRPQVFYHIKTNAKQKGIYLPFLNGYDDHVHALISLQADQNIANLMQLIKGESSYWFNQQHWIRGKFEWASEYYAASVSQSLLPVVKEYIRTQEEHHRKMNFAEECQEILREFLKYQDLETTP